MNKSALSFTLVLALAVLAAWLAPAATVQPGNVLPAHADLSNQCTACHLPMRGVTSERCKSCHNLADIGLRNSAGEELKEARVAVQGLHQRNQNHACTECHAEHADRLGAEAAARFTHERLSGEIAADCASCHSGQEPADDLHAGLTTACGACHSTEAWKPASFDHASVASDRACFECHAKDRPADDLHQDMSEREDCAACHASSGWKPARYEHSAYFRFDGHHPAHCADCHTPGQGYKRYSCTGCHAHSPARIAAEHREEGISQWQDCVRCHRSGSEHEAGEGGERGEGRGGGEHEEDDD